MTTIWRKVWRDLFQNKLRTLLVVLSSAAGVFALGLVVSVTDVIHVEMAKKLLISRPANIWVFTEPVSTNVAESVSHYKGVADAQLFYAATIQWKKPGETVWRNATLNSRPDYQDQRIDRLVLTQGVWSGKHEIMADQLTYESFGVKPGETILIQRGRSERAVTVVGAAASYMVLPPAFGGEASFLSDKETFDWLSGNTGYSTIGVVLNEWKDKEDAEEWAKSISSRLQATNVGVGGHMVIDPERHFLQDTMDGIFVVLGVLGVLSLGLSGFLIINTMNALIAQQIWQIGVMKVIGATFRMVVTVFLATAALYGLLSVAIAVPLAAICTSLLSNGLLSLMSITLQGASFSVPAILLQLAVGVLVPVLAALVPVIGGARISAHLAISNYGLGLGFGSGWLDKALLRGQQALPLLRDLPRNLTMALRNTFRRKARVALTLVTLVVGGLMFISVMSVSDSLSVTLEDVIDDFGWHGFVITNRLTRSEKLVDLTKSVAGINEVETWNIASANFKPARGGEIATQIWGIPAGTTMFAPNIAEGRWVLPNEANAVLVSHKLAKDENIRVGDAITLSLNSSDSKWTVVGIATSLNNGGNDIYADEKAVSRELGYSGRSTAAAFRIDPASGLTQAQAVVQLNQAFKQEGITIVQTLTMDKVREQNMNQFGMIITLLLVMSILAAAVGSLGLMGTMSINVVERRREIGVMRSIGGTSLPIAGIFVAEGVLVGLISWAIAMPLSYPVGLLFSNLLGEAILPMTYSFSVTGLLLWLGVVTVLAALASLWPALQATRISVRESLAYE